MEVIDEILASPFGSVTILCGAGVSLPPPTALPTVARFLDELLTECRAPKGVKEEVLRRSREPLAPRFEALIEEIVKAGDRRFLVGRMFETSTFNEIHSAFAALLGAGASIITTNFDNAIEHAAASLPFRRLVFDGRDTPAALMSEPILCKVHGSLPANSSLPSSSLVLSVTALSLTNDGFRRTPNLRRQLRALIDGRTVIVLGYSGSDDFDVTPLLVASAPSRVFWFVYDPSIAEPREIPIAAAPPNVQLFGTLPLRCYQGAIDGMLRALATAAGGVARAGKSAAPALTVADYVRATFDEPERRRELMNVVLLQYALYDLVLRSRATVSQRVAVQRLKALYRLGRHAELDAEARGLAEPGAPDDRFAALYFHAASLSATSRDREAIDVMHRLIDAAGDDDVARMNALNQLGGVHLQTRQTDDAARAFQEALALQGRTVQLAAEAGSNWGLAAVEGIRGNLAGSLDLFRRARKVYASLGDDSNLAWADYNCADCCMNLDRLEEAKRYLADATKRFRALRTPNGIMYVTWMAAKLAYRRGAWKESLKKLEQVSAIAASEAGFPWLLDFAMLLTCARVRAGLTPRSFDATPLAETLRALDAPDGRLSKLLGAPTAENLAEAEHWVFVG